MHNHQDSTSLNDAVLLLAEHGFDGMAQAIQILLNEAMKIERSDCLGAQPYERSENRRGHANGFKPKTVQSRLGSLELQVPQTRGVEFYPSALERGERSERALKVAVAEMYVQGVSTRKVAAITEQLCGLEINSAQVSRAAKLLDDELEAWRNRPLGEVSYLILDARYEKVRQAGAVVGCAILIAIGVLPDGKRVVLGVSVSLSEAEVHWRDFLASLQDRGMHGVKLISSDSHAGLKEARQARFPSVPWQRCQFHLMQNAFHHIPKVAMRPEVIQDIQQVFASPDRATADEQLVKVVKKYERTAPPLANWLEKNIPEGLTVLGIPKHHQKRLRTTNALERLNKEIKRRTRVATLFPNPASALRLISAILMEITEDWETGKAYLTMEAK